MSARIDLTDKRFGRWTVEKYHSNNNWVALCSCGTKKIVDGKSLRTGISKSCGCMRTELNTKRLTTHGMRHTAIYEVWCGMKGRCLNVKKDCYKDYGGRGIKVCDRWLKFENFLADMGERPEGMSIERIDNDGNYEPGNCKWATSKEQSNNKRSCVIISYGGKKMSLKEWAKHLNINYGTLWDRINRRGWSIEKAFSNNK